MKEIALLVNNINKDIQKVKNIFELEKIRIKYLGKKGIFLQKIKKIKTLKEKDRPKFGIMINKAKKNIIKNIKLKKQSIENKIALKNLINDIDVTLPGLREKINKNLHPITNTINIIESIFTKIGFTIAEGKEIEDEYHNFDALNISKYHPSRKNKDTFWINDNLLLRTQTSSVQIHQMKKYKPPIKMISYGKVFRKDYDSLHTPMFHQIEGFLIDINISFANLKELMNDFLLNLFNFKKIKTRLRPSYFPFTEPSAEIDIMNDHGTWIEILGCGMVHPYVLKQVNIDSKIYSGFAFGIGIERLASLIYNVQDIRDFFENDLRFLNQFK